MVVILLYVDDVVLLSKSRVELQRLLSKLHEFCIFFLALKSTYLKLKIVIFGHNKMKLNQEALYLDTDQNEITHKYKYLGIDFYSHGYFESSSRRRRMLGIRTLMDTSRKEAIVGYTCQELKSHLFKALVFVTSTYGTEIWGGDFKNSHWKDFEKNMKIHIMSHVKVHSLTTYCNLFTNLEDSP